tara:strand:- start:10203 stop:10394 length:192 start_codon:yes stop_codon:yes gene_type:complete
LKNHQPAVDSGIRHSTPWYKADDMPHAVELMSKHPGVKVGPFEIRPADETINAMIEARNQLTK